MARLKDYYNKNVKKELMDEIGYKNINQVPKLEKIIVNSCSRDCLVNSKIGQKIADELSLITGQKAMPAKAKKSVAGFKLREGQVLGAFVTLRGDIMYEFLDRLVNITLPRVRDFRGVSVKSFDDSGNYTLGLKEQIIFPEIEYDKIDKVRGLNISFVTSSTNRDSSSKLLSKLGIPFERKE
jgi:large subunit ribosomal protein L5